MKGSLHGAGVRTITCAVLAAILLLANGARYVKGGESERGLAALPNCRVYPGGSSDPNKPVLILLHGWNSAASLKPNGETDQRGSWGDLERDIAPLYRGIVYFSYNRDSEEYTKEDTYQSVISHHSPLLHDLIQSCAQRGYKSFDLIGHSLGGVVAMDYIRIDGLKTPGLVRHVVTLDSPVNGGEIVYKLQFLPDSLGDVVKNLAVKAFGRTFLGIRPGDQNSMAEIAAMYQDRDNWLLLNKNAVRLLKDRGTRIATFTNSDDVVILPSDALIPDAAGHAFSLGCDLPGDSGHDRIFQTRTYPQVLQAIRAELETAPSVLPPKPGSAASTATMFVIDVSGSMGDSWRGGVKIESAKSAAAQVLDMIEQESKLGEVSHQVGLATFTSDARLELDLTSDYAQARSQVAGLRPQANTNLGAGLQVANGALASAPVSAKKIIILLSDGMSNTGLSRDQILAGPTQDAASAGTCIYTVGFGDQGDLDEDLLKQIAARSGCGEYYYASAATQLEQVYIKLRHQSLGNVIAEYAGQVSQGQTVSIGNVPVPANQSALYATLHWPGSGLDFIITDPRGRRVDQNYPGASLAVYERLVYIIIQNPLPGVWLASTLGRNVPEGTLDYDAVFSVRERTGPLPPILPAGSIIVVLIVALAAAGGVGYLAIRQSSGSLPPAGAPVVQVVRGQTLRPWARIGGRGLVIGRDPRQCGLVIADPRVSRRHAQIVPTPAGYVITDLNSTGGVYVNGQRVTQATLHGGETVRLGDSEMVFQAHVERNT